MKSKILIIDDEENIRFGFKLILNEAGYETLTAEDYDSALQIISESSLDLIISDIILGGYSGIDLLNEVKKRELGIPVIMITGEPNIETSSEAVRLGAFDYIYKPIRKDNLLRITELGLKHKELLDKKRELEIGNSRVRHNMEAIFRSIRDGIITVDKDLRVIEANAAVKKICNFSGDSLVDKNLEDMVPNCGRGCLNVLQKTLETGETVENIRVECRNTEPEEHVVALTCTPLLYDKKKSSGAVLVVRDITRLENLELQLNERHQFHNIIGKSSNMQKIYSLMENLADTDSTVLITGETGTGKELIAQAVHYNSERKEKSFVSVNCSALAENLLESELFGHVKGAFTGAVKSKKGRFQLADKGTIFLDEIGDISPLIQLKLLRVLQEREFEMVGDSTPVNVDIRVISATNCDLKEKVRNGEFREDLYYRIKVIDIPVPPLKERREDIPLLTGHFIGIFNRRFKKEISGVSNEVLNTFMNYSWPGNIRELEHAVEHGFVLCRENTILFDHLPVELKDNLKIEESVESTTSVTKDEILQALNKTDWNKSKAARLLGIGRRTIYRKIELFNISK